MCDVMAEIVWFYIRVIVIFTKLSPKLNDKYIGVTVTEYTWPKRTWSIVCLKIEKENQRVKVRSRVFNVNKETWIHFFLKILICCWFHYFSVLSRFFGSCREKSVFVQHHDASLHSKLRQTAFKLTQKSLDCTQIGTLPDPWINNL